MQTPESRWWIVAALSLLLTAPVQAQTQERTITLQETIDLALQTDPLAVAAATDLATAEADQLVARGSWLPQLTLTSGYSKSSQARVNRSTGLLSSESYSAGAQASIVLFAGGERIAQNRAANARVVASSAEYRAQTFETILGATEAFYEAAAARHLSALAEQRRVRAEQQLAFAKTRLELGTATTSDVLRAEIELGNAELAVLDAAASFRTATLNLGRWVGVAGGVQPVAEALPERAPELPDRAILVESALRSSPLVVASEAELKGVEADRWTGYSAYLPVVELIGGYDWSSAEFPPDRRSWNVSLAASLPLFDQFRREAAVKRDAALLRLARARSRDARIAIQASVESALQEVLSAEQRVEVSKRASELAREDLRVLEERYQADAATILDLQASQVALTESEIAAVRARQALGTALAELETVLGRKLEEIGDE